ncbi:MAG: hypothetical protein Q8M92_07530, partial [Candidatus Subteraquimicrobiales bacterium]|nr:hypothetical protein [Candidatus Subteraquimicrobiales bacterium]
RSNLQVGYDMSGMAVPLITSIPSRNGYYSDEDLDDLANAGWYMLQQESDGAPVVCYLQKTTAYDILEKSEESFIVALDFAMRDIRETCDPYTKGGLDNRISPNPTDTQTAAYLAKLNAAISPLRYKYVDTLKAFSVMEVVAVRVIEMKRTATDIIVRFVHYYPAREVYVTAYVE